MAEGFAFSSFRSSHPLSTLDSRSNGLDPVADDDAWGDFVKSPQQSQFADPPINSLTGKGNSPLAPTSRWVKPSGALPLSFFGAAEEEEEQEGKDAADFNLGRSNISAANFNSVFTENSKNLSAGNLFSHTSLINGENGPSKLINKDSVLVENRFHSNSDLNVARSDSTDSKNFHINGAVGRSDQSQLTKNGNSEFSFMANVFDPNHKYDLYGAYSLDLNESSSNSNSANPSVKTSYPNSDMNDHTRGLTGHAPPPDDDDDDDDGWEFQDAYSEPNAIDLSNKVDLTPHDVSAMNTFSPGSASSSNEIRNLLEPAKESIDLFAPSTSFVHTFAASSAGSHGSQDVELISTQPSKASDYDSNIKENDAEGILNPSPDVESADFDEDFGEFTAASAETKPEQVRKDTNSNFHRSALPMSIFGDEEPESDGFLDGRDAFVHRSISESDSHTSKSVISINDLISSLYNQTEKTSINTTQEPNTVELNLSSSMTSSNLGNGGDHRDDNSSDFKDAFSQRSWDNEASLYSFGDAHLQTSSKMKLNNHLDFYSKLKEALCFVSKNHIERLKQSLCNDAILGEDSSISDLASEFQMLCKELEQMDYLFDKQDHTSNDSYLSEFIEILLEPQFQILESEYHLSEQLLLVEKDMKSAMELIRHTTSMFKILTLGTSEEKTTYISVWSNIISACAQELKEGASIWTKAAEKHVRSQLLAKTQGRNFVLELGEIYRVVVILGASAKLFKPWTISCSIDLSGIYILLEECHALWSTSGLEEALYSVQVSTASEDALLFKSINDIRGLDATALQNYVFMEKDSLCGLSMLSAGMVPGVKIIKWGEERYFVTIANLWANLISCTPPKLPQLRFGS
ncbi:uncharacterized protein [Primulina huaijiensis]|uniref:uncharacterized protein isoform X1 n=1 Tax=Primulina huaijiensis TaxID=1492673 RepID=UPI003CC73772